MRLALTLCGHVGVSVDGTPPRGATLGAKALALLAYLVMEPGPHGREELMALLWGDFPEAKARGSLRQALTHLRHALGDDALDVSRASVALAHPVECDVPALRHTARGDAHRPAATDADVSRFLADLPVRRCAAFDEWAEATRAALLRTQATALGEQARDALARLDWREAARAADRWRAADPGSDEAVRVAVEARHLAGDRAGALAVFAEHRARAAAESAQATDAPSFRALRVLVQRIAAGAPAPGNGDGVAAVTPPRIEPLLRGSLRGREREWATLRHSWRAARAGPAGRTVVIEGGTGAGKTRLAEDFARWAESQGATVLRARGQESGSNVPYGLIGDALRSGVDAPGLAGADGQWLAELSRLIPELRRRLPGVPASPTAASPGDAWRFFEATAQFLLALAAEQPVLVVLDDAHWSDADSASLVGYLVHRLNAGAPILWCATATLGAADRGAPGYRMVRALRALPEAAALSPAPLTERDVGAVITGLGGLSDSAAVRRLARQIHADTAGTPLYVTESLRCLFARGLVTLDPAGGWRLSPAFDADATARVPSVAELLDVRAPIAERIAHLAEDARDVLVTIAVAAGMRCDTDVLSHVHGISRLRAAALGETLLERALVVEDGGAYRCAHPVIAVVARDGVSASWRREVERALGSIAPSAAPGAPRGTRRPTTGWAIVDTETLGAPAVAPRA